MAETFELKEPQTPSGQPQVVTLEKLVPPEAESIDSELYSQAMEDIGDTAAEQVVVKPAATRVAERLERETPLSPRDLETRLGVTGAQAEQAFEEGEKAAAESRIAINLPRDALADVVGGSGRYKSVHEQGGATGGRGITERDMDIAPPEGEEHVIYGYLDVPGQSRTADNRVIQGVYGQSRIILRPEVSERSTYTMGDSINENQTAGSHHLLGFEDAVVAEKARQAVAEQHHGDQSFTEAQIQGGVAREDIEAVEITIQPEGKSGHENPTGPAKGWYGLDGMKQAIGEMSEAAPGLPLKLRISELIDPSVTAFSKDMIDFVGQHPEVEFEVVLDKDLGRTPEQYDEAVKKYWASVHGADASPPKNVKFVEAV